MPKTEIVIDIEHGIVSVYASEPDQLGVILVDWDSEGVDPRSPNMVSVRTGKHSHDVLVLDIPVEPLGMLAGTSTEQAVEAACESGVLRESVGMPIC